MSIPIQGQDVLILVNIGTDLAPNYSAVASQKNAQFSGQTPTIDVSGKQDAASKFVPGRNTDTCQLTCNYTPGAPEILALRNAYRTRQNIKIQRQELGAAVEQAIGVITSYQETFQDQQAAEVQMTVQVSGGWEVL